MILLDIYFMHLLLLALKLTFGNWKEKRKENNEKITC